MMPAAIGAMLNVLGLIIAYRRVDCSRCVYNIAYLYCVGKYMNAILLFFVNPQCYTCTSSPALCH